MAQFYVQLWLFWAFRVSLSSVSFAGLFASMLTFGLYVQQGAVALTPEVLEALGEVFWFCFPLVWSLTLLLALFRSLKHIFNRPFGGYELKLLSCDAKEILEAIGYGDLIKVWRRWFMLLIWIVAVEMILGVLFASMFFTNKGVFDWFSIYILYLFILIAGYFSFILLGTRCKKVKLIQC